MLKRLALHAVSVVAVLLVGTGCHPECTVPKDCADKGDNYVCTDNKCVPATQTSCNPICSGATPVCDANGSNFTCKTCTATAGCGTGQTCDTAANGGLGQCVTCAKDADCTAPTVCDTSVPGGQCVQCDKNEQCSTGVCDTGAHKCVTCTADNSGCANTAHPLCDTSVAGGKCYGCNADTDCGTGGGICDTSKHQCVTCKADGTGCTSAHPICNITDANPSGVCVTCKGDGDCSGGKVCDTSVAGGICVECTSDANCADPANPYCDPARHTCLMCKTDGTGCNDPANPTCDTTSGRGQCITCSSAANPDDACDRATSGVKPVCNVGAGTCVECTGSGASQDGCTGGTFAFCGGDNNCKACLADGTGCSGATPTCDTALASGRGACVLCRSSDNVGCSGSTPVCKTDSACVECTADANCSGNSNGTTCDLAAGDAHENQCRVCYNTASGSPGVGCGGTTPYCNTAEGTGACHVCLNDATSPTGTDTGCGGATPHCLAEGSCHECTNNQQCSSDKDCDDVGGSATYACVNPGDANGDAASVAAQIQAVRDAVPGSQPNLPIHGALVTAVKPLTGGDAAGFFVQATKPGPAIFVQVDPASLSRAPVKGDRVGFDVTATQRLNTAGPLVVTAITNFVPKNAAGDVHDVSALIQLDPDTTSDPTTVPSSLHDTFESELLGTTTNTVVISNSASFLTAAGSGSGWVSPTNTRFGPNSTTNASGSNVRLRYSEQLADQLDLILMTTCTLQVKSAPAWRFTSATADNLQPLVLDANDVVVTSCALPGRVSRAAALGPNSVRVFFEKHPKGPLAAGANGDTTKLDPAQFTISNGLTVTAAQITGDGKQVTLTTTGAQDPATTYTVTIGSGITDQTGTAFSAANTATFTGYVQPAGLVITEIDRVTSGSHDLIELEVTSDGSAAGYTLMKDLLTNDQQELARLPQTANTNGGTTPVDYLLHKGDRIIIHVAPAAGDIDASEISGPATGTGTTVYNGQDGAHPAAWDFIGNLWSGASSTQPKYPGTGVNDPFYGTDIPNSQRVVWLRKPDGTVGDTIVLNSTSTVTNFPLQVQAVMDLGTWKNAADGNTCAGGPCQASNTNAASVAVNPNEGTTATYNAYPPVNGTTMTIQRVRNGTDPVDHDKAADWIVAPATLGGANPVCTAGTNC